MRTVLHKWFWVWDYDKEEKWLNQKAAEGLALVATGICRYEFEDCERGEYLYRLELLENHPDSPESRKYLEFLEEAGIERVGSYMRWVYLRKKAADGPFDLFSDYESRIAHLNRILCLLMPITLLNLGMFLIGLNQSLGWVPFLNLSAGLLCLYGVIRFLIRKNKYKKEREISEN